MCLLVAVSCGDSARDTDDPELEITVAAASDLRPAFEELRQKFLEQTGVVVTYSFGSSGQLAQQILQGAPFDLFASANVKFVDEVLAAGRGVASTKAMYALGRIVLWSSLEVSPPQSVEDLVDPRYRRIVIANPDHAPYGLAAKQALESAGMYSQIRTRLIYGENVSDALRIASSGNADVGIVALSLALVNDGNYVLIPAELHEPLEQALVVTSSGVRGRLAADFANFVGSSVGREVMNRYGFVLPPEWSAVGSEAGQ